MVSLRGVNKFVGFNVCVCMYISMCRLRFTAAIANAAASWTKLPLKIYTWMDDFGQNVNFAAYTERCIEESDGVNVGIVWSATNDTKYIFLLLLLPQSSFTAFISNTLVEHTHVQFQTQMYTPSMSCFPMSFHKCGGRTCEGDVEIRKAYKCTVRWQQCENFFLDSNNKQLAKRHRDIFSVSLQASLKVDLIYINNYYNYPAAYHRCLFMLLLLCCWVIEMKRGLWPCSYCHLFATTAKQIFCDVVSVFTDVHTHTLIYHFILFILCK